MARPARMNGDAAPAVGKALPGIDQKGLPLKIRAQRRKLPLPDRRGQNIRAGIEAGQPRQPLIGKAQFPALRHRDDADGLTLARQAGIGRLRKDGRRNNKSRTHRQRGENPRRETR